MENNGFGEWRGLMYAAIQEADPELLVRRLDEAETSIHHRLAQLSASGDRHGEIRFIRDAQRSLGLLRRLSPCGELPIGMIPAGPATKGKKRGTKRRVEGATPLAG